MPDVHAVLSASSSARWIACPPSAKLNAEGNKSSAYAEQGTDAHALAEYKLLKYIGHKARDPTNDLAHFDSEMDECTDNYVQFIAEEIEKMKIFSDSPTVCVEQRVDFGKWVPGGFGTCDALVVSDSVLHICDLKYGVGLLINAEFNSQLMCYALGALDLFDSLYDIQEVRMTIFQPRREHISSWTISRTALLDWAENTLKPAAELAAKGEGDFCAGSHCQFCRVKATCRARADYNLQMARYDFERPAELEDAEIEDILSKADELISWANDVKDYAFKQALGGKQWNGWKLVEGRSCRKYTDEYAVAAAVKSAGYNPYEQKLLGITSMEKLLGKKKFGELLGSLTVKPQGKPTLVPTSDKRASINTVAEDFKED